eukprot:COSAG03_NODE_232_length_10264_cov_2.708706_10_plen_84_part_00
MVGESHRRSCMGQHYHRPRSVPDHVLYEYVLPVRLYSYSCSMQLASKFCRRKLRITVRILKHSAGTSIFYRYICLTVIHQIQA